MLRCNGAVIWDGGFEMVWSERWCRTRFLWCGHDYVAFTDTLSALDKRSIQMVNVFLRYDIDENQ